VAPRSSPKEIEILACARIVTTAGFWQPLADRPKHQAAPSMTAPITTEECRRKAQKCIAESARAHANFNVSADWLY
jgi:hypothetical protein